MRRTEERSLEKLRKNLNAETKCENYKRNKSSIYGITLIALVITIVLNCSYLAMERMLNKENILKI